jgi:hypothetical protein
VEKIVKEMVVIKGNKTQKAEKMSLFVIAEIKLLRRTMLKG